ncbi:MAG: tRNA uridine-5-carboxymethylaminomethyl(34) synthesis GTPase MnmE [Deltaproteobacteria bacterium]|nr:MAG: tRNA uridine-5-carboxymethylaminomethyl(34) synthesis GTPase MnmE [Deltaproteobacteria bacterium]
MTTIYALATPPGRSALALIRVSGPKSHDILKTVFKPLSGKQKNFVVTRGTFSGIDDVICVKYPNHKSFTGEKSFEVISHGNPVIISLIFEKLENAGAVFASPGEFTKRSFLSGKINLMQAESICALISAKSERLLKFALTSLSRENLSYLDAISELVIKLLSEIEVRLNFPEELIPCIQWGLYKNELRCLIDKIKTILKSHYFQTKMMEGFSIAICGMPNVGKSTLLNSISGQDKSLVYDLPGTTRDIIDVEFVTDGFSFTFIDTAGLHKDAQDPVEKMGIHKTKEKIKTVCLVIALVLETCNESMYFDLCLLENSIIEVFNKIDLHENCKGISGKTHCAISVLIKSVISIIFFEEDFSLEYNIAINKRQKNEFDKIYTGLNNVLLLLSENDAFGKEEFVAEELNYILTSLESLYGKNIRNGVLEQIFSSFCIGK